MKVNTLPTGYLFSDMYDRGELETLSIGDYGKAVNVKADFLGYTKEINGVPNTVCMPLSEKWVITLSTQYGCPQKCTFCLPPDTEILMSDLTYKKVEDITFNDTVIANKNPKENINNPIKQYATTITTVSKVTGLMKRLYNGDMYTIKTDNKQLSCTYNHPIATKYKSRILYKDADKIKVGDDIVVCHDFHENKSNDWRLGWLHGFMDGDGVYDVSQDGVDRCFVAQNGLKLLEFVKEICCDLGVKTTNIWSNGDKNNRLGILGSNLHTVQSLRGNTTLDYIKGYLGGYWDAEGFSLRNNKQYRIVETDKSIVDLVISYLKMLGVDSSYFVRSKRGCKDCYILTAKIDKDFFVSLFKPRHAKRLYITENTVSKTFSYYEKVISVDKKPYNGFVYNFETTEHNYYANNVLTHNCDVPKLGYHGNATFNDLKNQMFKALGLFPNQKYCERLNIHYARMGEPIYNDAVFEHAIWMYQNKTLLKELTGVSFEVIHPVLTTSLPRKFKKLEENILRWCDIKNNVYNGQAGLQFSINSTDEEQRSEMYQGLQLTLEDLARIADKMPMPLSRKYCLNFAYASNYEVDGAKIANLFDPDKFMCKITPIHNNNACRENGIKTIDGYENYTPYKIPEQTLKDAGFDVLVFVPSMDEEDGLVTCGNLALSGSETKFKGDIAIKIVGQ